MAIPNRFGDNNDPQSKPQDSVTYGALAAYCMERVTRARRVRDEKWGERWKEYTRLWRGFYVQKDKNNEGERSQIVAPALQQSIEMTVAEMEEAVFNRPAWFDIEDDIADTEKEDALQARDQLLEDFELDNVGSAVSATMLLGAIYGTGIGKLNVVEKMEAVLVKGERQERDRIAVTLSPVRPDEFVIDESALTVDEAEFCAHEMIRPLWGIKRKQAQGLYRKVSITAYSGQILADPTGMGNQPASEGGVMITEYYGQIPVRFIPGSKGVGGMVEAIVTIANETTILRVTESPFLMKDRPIIAYQHDTVPGEFWGRGVCEKGFNPQKALDAELRARIDALALISAPMMGADITRLPRNGDFRVRPGKTVFTRGRPSEVLETLSFGDPAVLAHTFAHTGDLERMVQMGTGAMDSATPVGVNSRNETASGMSMMQGGFIKRSKRTMQNLERNFLDQLVRKSVWRQVQFNPELYPKDYKFKVNATLGIMAKEVENSQLVNMLGFLKPEDPARNVIIKAIFDNTASANKAELLEAFKQMTAPPSPEQQQQQQQMQQIQFQMLAEQLKEQQAQTQKVLAEIEKIKSETEFTNVKADLEDEKVDIQAANAAIGAEKTRITREQTEIQREKNQLDAEARREVTNGPRRNGTA